MSELANYSIETDRLIFLAFQDGSSLRVPVSQLPRYLTARDLQKVRRAIKLRRDFFRQHMPRALVVVAVLGALSLLATGTAVVAWLMQRDDEIPAQPNNHTEVARTIDDSSPAASSGLGSPAPATPSAKPKVAAKTKPVTTPKSSKLATKPAVAVTPIAGPEPTPGETTPEATPPAVLPTPEPAPQGQVLGESTGPDGQAPTTPTQ